MKDQQVKQDTCFPVSHRLGASMMDRSLSYIHLLKKTARLSATKSFRLMHDLWHVKPQTRRPLGTSLCYYTSLPARLLTACFVDKREVDQHEKNMVSCQEQLRGKSQSYRVKRGGQEYYSLMLIQAYIKHFGSSITA